MLRATRDHNIDVRAQAGQALDSLGTAAVVVGMSAMLGPMIAEAVGSAVQVHGLAQGGPDQDQDQVQDRNRPAPEIDHDRSAQADRPIGLLGVGEFQDALEEARSAGEPSQ